MTINVVQTGQSADLASPVTLGAGLTQGNWLVIIAGAYNTGGSASPPVSPTVGGAAITATSLVTEASGTNPGVAMVVWLAQVTSAMAGQTAINFSEPGSEGPVRGFAIEASSATALSLDTSSVNNGNGTSASIGPTAGSASAGELAVYGLPSLFVDPTVSGGGWTIFSSQQSMSAGYQILGASGSTAAVSASLSGTGSWCGAIALIQAAAGGGSHMATASLTVTPTFTATAVRAAVATATLTITPGFTATASKASAGAGTTSRAIVRRGVATFFGGTNYDSIFRAYRNGPLMAYGLSTVRAFQPKRLPDMDYVLGQAPGRGMGAVMILELAETRDVPMTIGQNIVLNGQRKLVYPVQLHVFHMAHEDFAEDAEADVDAIDQAIHELIYTDATLGGICYQAGMDSAGIRTLIDQPEVWDEITVTHFRVCLDVEVQISIGG